MNTWPNSLLMVHPEYFTVEYNINPHMLDANGELNKIDCNLALTQWQDLKQTFESLGLQVQVMPGAKGLPDMVFCANQTFPFYKDGKKHLILSQMHSDKRKPEVKFFKEWADSHGYHTHALENENFEGMGDALWNYESGQIFAGYGFRTSPQAYEQIEKFVEKKIVTFELKDSRFYHLDTCLAILNNNTAAFVREAFTPEGVATLESFFSNLIEVPSHEAHKQLAGNMCCVNGQDVVLQTGATQTVQLLKKHGFRVHEVDTGEFIKSGGSVFCMKQLLF